MSCLEGLLALLRFASMVLHAHEGLADKVRASAAVDAGWDRRRCIRLFRKSSVILTTEEFLDTGLLVVDLKLLVQQAETSAIFAANRWNIHDVLFAVHALVKIRRGLGHFRLDPHIEAAHVQFGAKAHDSGGLRLILFYL